jgi:hypothetical protein
MVNCVCLDLSNNAIYVCPESYETPCIYTQTSSKFFNLNDPVKKYDHDHYPVKILPYGCAPLTFITSMVELERVNGAVGRATPSLTGAMRLSAISHSSSTASLMSAWNTRLHLTSGVDRLLVLQHLI